MSFDKDAHFSLDLSNPYSNNNMWEIKKNPLVCGLIIHLRFSDDSVMIPNSKQKLQ